MNMLTRHPALLVAGVCGTAFLSYCIYFDRKRRSHPDFKKKLREARQKKKESQTTTNNTTQLPDLRNVEAVQKFFLEEVQKGEELLGMGKYDEGVEHLTNAVAVCGQPQQLLQVLQQTLPEPVFHMLLEKLPTISQRLATSPAVSEIKNAPKPVVPPSNTTTATIADVDELE